MAYEYDKNQWEGFIEDIIIDKQPNAIITEEKLNKMEQGIERASMTIEPGNITMSNTEKPSVSVTVDEFSHTRKINIAFPKLQQTDGASIRDDVQSKDSTWSSDKINGKFNEIEQLLADLAYEPIEILSFNNNVNLAEFGSTINTITFTWTLSRIPTTLRLNGIDIDVNLKTSKVVEEINKTKHYELKAIDEKGNTSSKTSNVQFVNGIYYGVGTLKTIENITSSFILNALTKTLSTTKAIDFTVNAGSDEHIFYAYPSRFGESAFYVGGFEGGFQLLGSMDFINAYGYTEKYYVYMSTNANLGNTKITCK